MVREINIDLNKSRIIYFKNTGSELSELSGETATTGHLVQVNCACFMQHNDELLLFEWSSASQPDRQTDRETANRGGHSWPVPF